MKLVLWRKRHYRSSASSLPLRGIETLAWRGVGTSRTPGPHCPYEGLKQHRPVGVDAPLERPHCPYEGLKREHVQPDRLEARWSSLPLRGIETPTRWPPTSPTQGPHCPYEGLKPGPKQHPQVTAVGSSLPLRGIETLLPRPEPPLRLPGPHCPYEGLKPCQTVSTPGTASPVLIAPTRD